MLVLFFVSNFTSVYRIVTNLRTKMHPYTTFLCFRFQGNQITCFHFYGNFHTLTKRRKIIQETKPMFMSPKRLVEIWNDGREHLRSKNCLVSYKQHVFKNCMIVLPVNILMGMTRRLLGPHNTLWCDLIHRFFSFVDTYAIQYL